MLSILALILLLWLLIQTEIVQNFIVGKVTKRLSKDLNTEVSIKHVSFALFNRMNLEGTLVKDLNKDTLLYSNQIKLRVTDWFFLQDTLVLKFVGLEDTRVKMQRRDSIWNYQFLIDHFSSDKPKTKKSKLQFDLKKLDFKNIAFIQNDLWSGKRMEVKLGSLQLDADNFNFQKNVFSIKELDLDKPLFSLENFAALRPPVVKIKKPSSSEYYFNSGGLELRVGRINIRNGIFNSQKETDRLPYPYFDGQHLRFEKITGTFSNISFLKDTIKARIDFGTKERSGFEVKKLRADFKLTPQIMEFARLDLITPQSHLQNYYAMKFDDLNKDFGNYVQKVLMTIRFTNAVVDSDDLAYFAPAAKAWNKRITIWGNSVGTVSDLDIKNLFIRAGENTSISGDVKMKGLPDINNTMIRLDGGRLKTNYRDATIFVPSLAKVKTPSLSSLGTVQFTGNFAGTVRSFTTAGNFSTSLGAFTTNVTMRIPASNIPDYNGRLLTRQFNIGRFLQSNDLGTVSFDGTIKGRGIQLANLRTTLAGKIPQFDFRGYNYKNILVEGTFQRRQFDGSVKVDDPNLNLTTTVKIDLRNEQPVFNVLGDLAGSNFQNLGFTNRRTELIGLFDLNFSGKNIDQFLGSVKVFNASLLQDETRINIDSLSLQSQFENGQRSLLVNSNEFDAKIVGEYNILDLPLTFQVFLHKYYPAYINAPRSEPKNQRFTFEANTKNIEEYPRLFNDNITGLSYSTIKGSINTIDTLLTFDANVPYFAFKQYGFTNVMLTGKGNLNNLQLDGSIGDIRASDSTSFPNTDIRIISQKDVSQVSIKASANNTLNELNLNADVHTLEDGVMVKFNPSDFVINDKRWVLEKEGEIVVRKRFVSAENVRFTQGEQVIEIATEHDNDFDQSNLVVKLSSLNIGDFSPFIVKGMRLEGLASGNIVLKDFYGNFGVEAELQPPSSGWIMTP